MNLVLTLERNFVFRRLIFFLNLLIFFLLLFGNAYSQDAHTQLISIKLEKVTLSKTFQKLENESGYSFRYSDDILNDKRLFSFSFSKKNINEIMNGISDEAGLEFKVDNKKISVKKLGKKKVEGKVLDNNGQPLPGCTIIISGTTIGTTSDFDGNFSMTVNWSDTLSVTFIGFEPYLQVVKAPNFYQIQLQESQRAIEDVVVTALGIKRSEKALGYSMQKVDGSKVADVKELDVVNALSGKVSGVSIIQADGAIGGGGSRIVIRGESSLAGNNDPLFIINGIPGSANDIAPDDIESVSILKGPAAAALYGSEAGAGVVIITSKSGHGVEGVHVELNSNLTFQTPLVLPKYQNTYGMGESGEYSYYDGNGGGTYDDTKYNWGPEFDGKTRSQFTGDKPWVAYPNNVKNFYQLGHVYINNVAVSNNTESGNYRFSYTNTDQRGILPNNGLAKNQFDISSTFKFFNKFTLAASMNYNRVNCENNKQTDVRFIQRNIDFDALKDYWVPGFEGEQQMNYRRSANNPYFELYENRYSYIDNKLILNVTLDYKMNDHFSIMGRYGTNYVNNEYFERHAKSTYKKDHPLELTGYYKNGQANTWEKTAEFLTSYKQGFFNNSINAKLSFGGTHFRKEYNIVEGYIEQLNYTNLYNLNNRKGYVTVVNSISELERNSLYVFLNLDYKGKVYFDITGRNDWSSTLPVDNNSFFYPSVALSVVMDEIFNLPQCINFWKFRASWAQVGKDIPEPYYVTDEKYTWTTNTTTGLVSVSLSDVQTDPDLKPEITNGVEIGTDIRFFNNRLGLDATVYYGLTTNQILKTSVSSTTGYNYFMINAGKISSKGIELTLNAIPIQQSSGFTWETQLNWSLDRTYVDELLEDDPTIDKVQSVNSFLYIEDKVGQRRGTFYGQAYEKTPDGQRLYSLSGDTRLTTRQPLGNYNPDWMASSYNSFSYKKFSASLLLDLRWGGLIYNEIERKLNMYGLSEATLLNNREGIVPDGMVEDEDGTYRKLTLEDLQNFGKTGGQSGQEYWANQMEETCPENELINDTYLKLREVRISYNIPEKIIRKVNVTSARLSLVGRNLAVWSNVKHVDPETYGEATEKSDFGYSTKVPGYANSSLPSVRTYGFSLNVKF